jgi:hypothetical protein
MEPDDLDEEIDGRDETLDRYYEGELQKEAYRRRFLYHDVEKLILTGFLTHTVHFSSPITFRSATDEMADRIIERIHGRDINSIRAWILASSVWMIDGMIVGGDRNAEYYLFKFFSDLPSRVLRDLYSIIDGFNLRVSRALEIIECFCYEPYSRGAWRPSLREIPRGEDNALRRIWRAFNLVEDMREEDYNRWEHTRAQMASMSAKGAKAVAAEERKMKSRERVRRNAAIEASVTRILAGSRAIEEAKVTVTLDGETFEVPSILSPRTTDELYAEMDKAMENRKDYHDLVVDKYKRGIQTRFESEREKREELFRTAAERIQKAEEAGGAPLVGYTAEQLKEMRLATPFTPKRESAPNESSSRLYDRYVKQEVKVGWIGLKGIPEEAQKEAPKKPSLNEALQNRKTTLR